MPINPKAEMILGCKGYAKLGDVPESIDIVDVFRPAEYIPDVVREAIARKQYKGDVSVIWLQEGIQSDDGKRLAEDAGIIFVQNTCMKKEHERLFGKSED